MKPLKQITLHLALAATMSAPAAAVDLDPATFQEYVGIYFHNEWGADDYAAETLSYTDPDRGSGYAGASGILPVTTEVHLDIHGSDSLQEFGGTVGVETRYRFAIEPLAAGLPASVPIILSAYGTVTVDTSMATPGPTFARISHPLGGWEAKNYDAYSSYNGTFSFDETAQGELAVDTSHLIYIYLRSGGQGIGSGFYYDGYAYLDPTIVIDPTFVYADQYRIVYSPGIFAIPEPEVWAMLLAGIGLLGLRLRRNPAGAWRSQ